MTCWLRWRSPTMPTTTATSRATREVADTMLKWCKGTIMAGSKLGYNRGKMYNAKGNRIHKVGLRKETRLVWVFCCCTGSPENVGLYRWWPPALFASYDFSTKGLSGRRIKAGQKNGGKS